MSTPDRLHLKAEHHKNTGAGSLDEAPALPVLDRDDIKQGLKVVLAAIDQVKSGISICVFPEGTRCKTKMT